MVAYIFGGATQSRTGLNGFAIRCITALLSRQIQNLQRYVLQTASFLIAHKKNNFPENLERETSLELATSTLARLRSTN
jgi:hypothetical protein